MAYSEHCVDHGPSQVACGLQWTQLLCKICSAIDVWLVEGLLLELALVAYSEHCVDHGPSQVACGLQWTQHAFLLSQN